MKAPTSLRLAVAALIGVGACAATTPETSKPAPVAEAPPLPQLVVVLEAEPGRNLRAELRAIDVVITEWWCSLSGQQTVTLRGSKEALEQARQLPIVKRELAPGERIRHPQPEWVGRIDDPGLCYRVYEGSASRARFFMKVSGPLTPEKRAALEARGMKITLAVPHNEGDATILTGEARDVALIDLAQLDFVVKIEKSGTLHLLQ